MKYDTDSTSTNSGVNFKKALTLGAMAIAVLAAVIVLFESMGKNNDQDWQVLQSVGGKIEIIDRGGYYCKWFGTVWTYPKYMQLEYTEEKTILSPNDDSVTVTFTDGGTAKVSTVLRIQTPTSVEQRMTFHRQFGGNLEGVRAHLTNALKTTGPLMSSSEHQTARKSEYSQLVEEQLNQGLFEMRRVDRVMKDQFDATGKPITVFATEVILNEKGLPTVAQTSPLRDVGINVMQFSVIETDYDKKTLEQFAVKKDAFLAAENSKAQREKEVQQRLMVEEMGRRQKAEIEAESNKQLAAATIRANQDKLVAETTAQQEKVVAETNAAKLVAVALQTKAAAETAAAQEKSVAETKAAQELAVAQLKKQAAEENGKAQIILAEAQKKSIELAGAITEKEQKLAEIAANRDVQISANLSKIAVPQFIISGANEGKDGGAGLTNNLINLRLIEAAGLIKSASK